MSCFHPLPAIRKKDSDQFRVGKQGESFLPYTDVLTGERIEPINIPCGKCIGCRIDYSRAWADRCVLESLEYPKGLSWFVTLTYDDDHIETDKRTLLTDKGTLTLFPKDPQDFLKRLREYWERVYDHVGIRFFMCGEYGSTTARPHYHMLLYNLPIHDLKVYSKNRQGDLLYTSNEISSLWGLGYVIIGELTWQTCAYTARYVLKKFKGKTKEVTEEHYKSVGLLPEYTRMSRMPGIAREFYERHKDDIYYFESLDKNKVITNDEIILPGGKISKPPKYFDRLRKEEDPISMVWIQEARKHVAELRALDRAKLTDLDEDAYFQVQEKKLENRLKGLTRFI